MAPIELCKMVSICKDFSLHAFFFDHTQQPGAVSYHKAAKEHCLTRILLPCATLRASQCFHLLHSDYVRLEVCTISCV